MATLSCPLDVCFLCYGLIDNMPVLTNERECRRKRHTLLGNDTRDHNHPAFSTVIYKLYYASPENSTEDWCESDQLSRYKHGKNNSDRII